MEKNFLKAQCKKTKRWYGLEIKKIQDEWKVVNMVDLSESEAAFITSEIEQYAFETDSNLLACEICGNRVVGGCNCSRQKHACKRDMEYHFDCVYCDKMELDYEVSVLQIKGMTEKKALELARGSVSVVTDKNITFCNTGWIMFDNISFHESGAEYNEPTVHIEANEKNIAFHGYNISAMNEGVCYSIPSDNSFEIECRIDTSTIKPHPGGCLRISLGILTAEIDNNGGTMFLANDRIASVGSKFKLKMMVKNGKYSVFIDGKLIAEKIKQKSGCIDIIFGFKHGPHHCHLLSHAYIKGIEMHQRVNGQQ